MSMDDKSTINKQISAQLKLLQISLNPQDDSVLPSNRYNSEIFRTNNYFDTMRLFRSTQFGKKSFNTTSHNNTPYFLKRNFESASVKKVMNKKINVIKYSAYNLSPTPGKYKVIQQSAQSVRGKSVFVGRMKSIHNDNRVKAAKQIQELKVMGTKQKIIGLNRQVSHLHSSISININKQDTDQKQQNSSTAGLPIRNIFKKTAKSNRATNIILLRLKQKGKIPSKINILNLDFRM